MDAVGTGSVAGVEAGIVGGLEKAGTGHTLAERVGARQVRGLLAAVQAVPGGAISRKRVREFYM